METGIQKAVDYLNQYFSEDAREVADSLGLLNMALDDVLIHANVQLTQFHKEKKYNEAETMLTVSKLVSGVQSQISDVANQLCDDEAEDSEDNDEDVDEKELKELPNYADYAVDETVPHTLYESFTHKKTVGFSLYGKHYPAKDWQDVLVKTCNLLAEMDKEKFTSFIDDPTMKGSKVCYFSRDSVPKRNEKLDELDVYVWVNLSANGKRNLIRKLLKKFDIRLSDYTIYLRADYTPLHPGSVNEYPSNDGDSTKIGKFVREELRKLENRLPQLTSNELLALQSKEWCKENLNLDFPLLRPVDENKDVSQQTKVGTYSRYWKELFKFGGQIFLVTSQWYDRNREPFAKWLQSLQQ